MCVCVCVCVRARARARARMSDRQTDSILFAVVIYSVFISLPMKGVNHPANDFFPLIIHFIYNAPVPVLQKRAPSTVQLQISGSIHG